MISRKWIVLGITALGAAGALGVTIRARASGIPATNALAYAGVLEDASGPINGSHNLQVILYDAPTAGTDLCHSATAAVAVAQGHFSVALPDACATAVGASPNVWADVLVDGSDTGRTKIGAVPFAVEAKHAVSSDGATNATHATTADTAANATHATTADTATNAANATGPLLASITALQQKAVLTQVSSQTAGPSDVWYADCVSPSASTIFAAGGCARLAQYKCVALGFTGGWFEGDISGGAVGIRCIR